MMIKRVAVILLMIAGAVRGQSTGVIHIDTKAPKNRKVEFIYRLPVKYHAESRIMVLFGGRNWRAADTMERYKFQQFADKYQLLLIAPTFVDDDYWEPEEWSGPALFKAIDKLEKIGGLKPRKLYYYGYSAGGQCAALFYAYAPERAGAWALHACGVYFKASEWKKDTVPAMITCGTGDEERYAISRHFIFNYRESGGGVVWRPYPGKGHELSQEALQIARQFFADQIERLPVKYIGDDDTRLIYPPEHADKILPEYRNPITSDALKKLWSYEP